MSLFFCFLNTSFIYSSVQHLVVVVVLKAFLKSVVSHSHSQAILLLKNKTKPKTTHNLVVHVQ